MARLRARRLTQPSGQARPLRRRSREPANKGTTVSRQKAGRTPRTSGGKSRTGIRRAASSVLRRRSARSSLPATASGAARGAPWRSADSRAAINGRAAGPNSLRQRSTSSARTFPASARRNACAKASPTGPGTHGTTSANPDRSENPLSVVNCNNNASSPSPRRTESARARRRRRFRAARTIRNPTTTTHPTNLPTTTARNAPKPAAPRERSDHVGSTHRRNGRRSTRPSAQSGATAFVFGAG